MDAKCLNRIIRAGGLESAMLSDERTQCDLIQANECNAGAGGDGGLAAFHVLQGCLILLMASWSIS